MNNPNQTNAIDQAALLTRYQACRQHSLRICRHLSSEDSTPQVAEFVSPLKWHLAHTTWFFETFVLKAFDPDYQSLNPSYAYLFNSYYVAAGARHARFERGLITRPSLEEVYDYRQHVDQQIGVLMQQPSKEVSRLVELGINHEQQHQELMITDLKYLFWHNPELPAYDAQLITDPALSEAAAQLEVSGGLYPIGYQGSGFCYDNETAAHQVYLPDYAIERQVATCQLMLDFIEAGGYQDPLLWHDAGFAWARASKQKAPLYWYESDHGFSRYTLAGSKPVDPTDVLTHINCYEAHALAEFAGKRLPTEFEFEVAAPKLELGHCWEWTSSSYLPYPGFKPAEGALGEYNGKFMINQSVLRGHSVATSEGHSRPTYRNFFPTDASWQFSGVRFAKR